MSNLFCAELYKWRRSKGFYGCLFGAVAMVVIVWMSFWFSEQISIGQIENGTMGVVVSGEVPDGSEGESLFDQFSIMDMVQTFVGGGVSTIFVAIVVCIWMIGEYAGGAIKNVMGKGYSRNSIFLVKYCSAVLISMVLNLLILITVVLIGIVVMGTGRIDGQFWKNCLAYTGIELMLCAAFAGMIAAVSEFTRNMAVGISVSIFATLFTGLIANGIDLFLGMLHMDFKVSDYWLTNVIKTCPVEGIGMDLVGRAIAVTIMWTLISLFAGMVHFHEADV